MIVIGEKINGAIPSVKEAIKNRDEEWIIERARLQADAGCDYIDCAPSTETSVEYETMRWLLELIQNSCDTPVCIDSPNAELLARILRENVVRKPGMVNSVNEEGTKCETIFPLIAGTNWNVIGLTCDQDGIPGDPAKKVEIAKRIIAKADHYKVALPNLHIDPCVMALATTPEAMDDFIYCIEKIHEEAPDVKVTGAISNISFHMPARKYVNMGCLTLAEKAGLDSTIMDPTNKNMMGAMYAAAALCQKDRGGRKYNRGFRKGIF